MNIERNSIATESDSNAYFATEATSAIKGKKLQHQCVYAFLADSTPNIKNTSKFSEQTMSIFKKLQIGSQTTKASRHGSNMEEDPYQSKIYKSNFCFLQMV